MDNTPNLDPEAQRQLITAFHGMKADLATVTDVLAECSEFWELYLHVSDGLRTRDRLPGAFSEAGVALLNALDLFVGRFEADREKRGLADDVWGSILNARADLRQALAESARTDLPLDLKIVARMVLETIASFGDMGAALHRETIRQLKNASLRVCSLSCFFDLLRAQERLKDTNRRVATQLESGRAPATSPVAAGTEFDAVVGELISQNSAFGDKERITFDPHLMSPGARVSASRDELLLGLGDLFLNALKYSDRLPFPEKAWITVRTKIRRDLVELSIENWGKPIGERELSDGLIFEYGYRGDVVRDTAIPGSGIGLSRSKEVIEKLGGQLALTCRPDRTGMDPATYTGKFVTIAWVRLPIATSRLRAVHEVRR